MPDTPAQPPIRPMSRGASRIFVIVCLLIALVAIGGSVWFLTRTAQENKEIIGSDSSAVRGFGVTEY